MTLLRDFATCHLVGPDGSRAVTFVSLVKLFARTFSKKSTVDDSGDISPTYSLSDSTMPVITILKSDVFFEFPGLNPQTTYESDKFPLIVLTTVFPF